MAGYGEKDMAFLQLFPELTPEDERKLFGCAERRTVEKDAWLLNELDGKGRILWLVSGEAVLMKSAAHGKSCIFHIVTKNHFVDLLPFFGRGKAYFSAKALCTCVVYELDPAVLKDIASRNPDFAFRLMQILAARQRMFANKIMASQGKFSVRRRIAGWLLHKNKDGNGSYVIEEHTRELLAGLLGITRESLCRGLAQLCKEGIIRSSGKNIEIADMERLAEELKR